MTKAEAWKKWWTETHGQNMPMGGYHPMEGHAHDAFTAGWNAADKQSQFEITHLKEQLLRANTNDGAYKAAFLAGQMSRDKTKRPWVGLTDEEMEGLYESATYMDKTDCIHLLTLAADKLKEKNT